MGSSYCSRAIERALGTASVDLRVQRRSCSDPDSRDGQTPGGGEIGGAVCGRLSSVVCRRGEPDLWENDLCTLNDRRMLVIKQPIGVVGAITPWNFPGSMVARKISPALGAGCTVVLKPAEQTPLVAGAMFALSKLVGFPDGVLNLVYPSEADAIGRELCPNPKVRKISFTGSRGRPVADAPVFGTDKADQLRTWRQCAFHGLRRCRYRRRGPRSDPGPSFAMRDRPVFPPTGFMSNPGSMPNLPRSSQRTCAR